MLDTKKRTILKTLSDKVMEIGLSQLICFIVGLPFEIAIGLPIMIELIQIGVYIINERIWSKIEWQTSHEGHLCETCGRTCSCPLGRHDKDET